MKTTTRKTDTKLAWKLLGYAGVDSGQLLICDPCYLPDGNGDSEWQSSGFRSATVYRALDGSRHYCDPTGKQPPIEGATPFLHFDATIPGTGKTPNQLIKAKEWAEEPAREPSRSFDYGGCCEVTLSPGIQGGQLNFRRGHGGAGVVASTHDGDGYYPVYGLFRGNSNRPMAMIVVTDEVTKLPELPV